MRLLLATIVVVLGLPGVGWSDVSIDNRGRCLQSETLAAQLEQVLRARSASPSLDLQVVVASTTDESQSSSVALTVRTPWGETLLERWYDLRPADCPSANKLLTLVLERFLSSFPAERWRALARKAKQVPPGPPRILEVTAHLAASSEWVPTGANAELGVGVAYGSLSHRFGAGIWGRSTMPRALGQGHYLAAAALAALSWRYTAYTWQPGVELRAGPALIVGYGYDVSYRRWAPWLDVVASLERRWSRVALGLQLTVTVLRHRVLTEDERDSEGLAIVGVGARVTVPIYARNL